PAAADARRGADRPGHPAGAARPHADHRRRERLPQHRRGGGGMTDQITLAVAARVLTQLPRGHRTLALLLVMPCVILALLWWMFGSSPAQGARVDAARPPRLCLV